MDLCQMSAHGDIISMQSVQSAPFKTHCLQTTFWFLRYLFIVLILWYLQTLVSFLWHLHTVFLFLCISSLLISYQSSHLHWACVTSIFLFKSCFKACFPNSNAEIYEKKTTPIWKKISSRLSATSWLGLKSEPLPMFPPHHLWLWFSHGCYNGIFVAYMLCSHVFLYLLLAICTFLSLLQPVLTLLSFSFFAIFTLCFQFCY